MSKESSNHILSVQQCWSRPHIDITPITKDSENSQKKKKNRDKNPILINDARLLAYINTPLY